MRSPYRLLLLLVIAIALHIPALAATYYVSYSTGNDANTGTQAAPFKTITKAVSVVIGYAGDVIILRGGMHLYSSRIVISSSKSGTASNRISLLAFPGERPILDFSAMTVGSSNQGLRLQASFWTIKGIDFYKAGDNGLQVSGGSNNIIEFCNFYENSDTGLQFDGGANNNQVINCDSYYNVDPSNGNADGFAVKLDVGTNNSFYGCRAWNNSDDGWDGYLRPSDNVTTIIENCWTFRNGYLKSGAASSGNGNGFKLGGSDAQDLRHNVIMKNCVAVYNRVKGFDQNNNRGDMYIYNCTGYRNAPNFGMSTGAVAAGKQMVVKNCISYSNRSSSDGFAPGAILSHNSWQGFTVSAADFESLDTSLVRIARSADGSIPQTTFMRLSNSSSMINAGTDVGTPYNGSAPDLGAFETNYTLAIKLLSFTGKTQTAGYVLLQWATAEETAANGFGVERFDNVTDTWKQFGFVTAAGNSTVPHIYQFVDKQKLSAAARYRLKLVDLDGAFTYSPVIVVNTSSNPAILQLYPNPSTSSATVTVVVDQPTRVSLFLVDQQGRERKILSNEVVLPGNLTRRISLQHLPADIYLLKLVTESGSEAITVIKL